MRFLLLVLCVLFFILIVSCGGSKNDKFNDEDVFFLRTEKVNDVLVNSRFEFCDSLLLKNEGRSILLLMSRPTDCISCIEKGEDLLLEFSLNNTDNISCYLIDSPSSVRVRVNMSLDSEVRSGLVEGFLERLKYLPSPLIVRYLEPSGVEEVYVIPTFDDDEQREGFLHRSLK